MANVNFDKAITHFETANIAARNEGEKALADITAGLQRLTEALHQDLEAIHKAIQELERKRP